MVDLETPCPDYPSETGRGGIAKGPPFNVGQIQSQQSQQLALRLTTLTAFFHLCPPALWKTLINIRLPCSYNIPCSSKHRTTLIHIVKQVLSEKMITIWHVQSCLLQNEVWSINICFCVTSFGELLNPMFCLIQTLIKAPVPWFFLWFYKKCSSKSDHILKDLCWSQHNRPIWKPIFSGRLSRAAPTCQDLLGAATPFFPSLCTWCSWHRAIPDGTCLKETFCCISGRRGKGKVEKTSIVL